MRLQISILAVALALAAGCDRGAEPAKPSTQSGPPPSQGSAPAQPQANTPTTPAPAAAGGTVEKNPTQGQVDPKQGDQHRDFQHKGDGAGPKSADTKPKAGSGS
jgi:hypothetical protein